MSDIALCNPVNTMLTVFVVTIVVANFISFYLLDRKVRSWLVITTSVLEILRGYAVVERQDREEEKCNREIHRSTGTCPYTVPSAESES